MTSMDSHLYTPEDLEANITAPTLTKSWRVMSGVKWDSPVTPMLIIRISRPFFSVYSLE
jgi:hypothetical protein